MRILVALVALLLALGAPTARAAVVEIEAGPIWADIDASSKCPKVCADRGAQRWTGDWHTTQPGRMSVCNCEFSGPGPGVGPRPGQPSRPLPVAGSNACSVGGTAKCPGCSVSCESGTLPRCDAPVDGQLSWCERNSSCRCERR
jgi:hypothetical protein